MFPQKELLMAKPNYSFQKRQRELAKKQKKEEKKRQKEAQRAPTAEAEPPAEPGTDTLDPGRT